jgi:mRNA-degrading endonuclease RelE of RelBE toxin-antitoxin system
MFEVLLDIPAQTFLKLTDEITYSRVKETLNELALDPVPQRAKRVIESKEKLFRLRSRHLRLLYRINYENQTLVVIVIEPLNRMYH